MSEKKYVVLALSGGMDSATLLLRLLAEGYTVTALSFDYGQKHNLELTRAQELVELINTNKANIVHHDHADEGFENIYPKVAHHIIKIEGLRDLLRSTLVSGVNDEVPEGHYEEETMKQTVVPNRNKIFSSIIQGVALSISIRYKAPVLIAMGIHAGDHAIYPDCRQEFRDADLVAFRLGNWDAEGVAYYTPYLQNNKADILKDGIYCCDKLGLDFDEVYKRTNTSYRPIFVLTDPTAYPGEVTFGNGIWYSDYKTSSSVERIEAFIKIGRRDPVKYADETGPVQWEVARDHVQALLDKHISSEGTDS